MQLQNYEEIIGILNKIKLDKNQDVVTLVFTYQKDIEIPVNAIDNRFLLYLVGKKIGILNIDSEYKIKEYQKSLCNCFI